MQPRAARGATQGARRRRVGARGRGGVRGEAAREAGVARRRSVERRRDVTQLVRRRRPRRSRRLAVAAVGSVHCRPPKGAPHEHAGSVHAATPSRRCRTRATSTPGAAKRVSIWVVPSAAITASTPRTWGRSSIPATTSRTGIRSSTRCRAGVTRSIFSMPTPTLVRIPAATRRRPAGARPSAVGVVRPRADSRGGHRAGERRARSHRPGDAAAQARRRGGRQGTRRGRARVFPRRDRVTATCMLVELPKGDFAFTIVRQFFFSVFTLSDGALQKSITSPSSPGSRRRRFKEVAISRAAQRASGSSRSATERTRAMAARSRRVDDLWRLHRRAVSGRRRRSGGGGRWARRRSERARGRRGESHRRRRAEARRR